MKKNRFYYFSVAILTLASLFVLFPFIWAILLSFKSNEEIMGAVVQFFPRQFYLEGYRKVLTEVPIFTWFGNSVIVAITVVVINVLTSGIAGYIFAKFTFPFKKFLFVLTLSTMMFPFQIKMMPMYLLINKMGLTNSLLALILPSIVGAFGIFLCRQFAEGIPDELLEAARIEGCGEFRILIKIVFPLLKASLASLSIFIFISIWNDYLWPLIAIDEASKMTMPIALSFFNTNRSVDFNAMMSASVLVLLPIIILYMFFQKRFIDGMSISGMK